MVHGVDEGNADEDLMGVAVELLELTDLVRRSVTER